MELKIHEVLLIDDDAAMFPILKTEFEIEGLSLAHRADGLEGLEYALSQPIALAIIDIQLPTLGGFEICRRLRAEKSDLPILLLTTRSEEVDKLIGFERGADDYVTKPFSVRELRARVLSLLRRGSRRPLEDESLQAPLTALIAESLELRLEERRAMVEGVDANLTRLEFELLSELMHRAGTVASRELLSEVVWENPSAFHDPTITATVSRLRKKLGDTDDPPRFIETLRGVGYRFLPAVKRKIST